MTAARRARTGAAMGPAATTTTHPPVPRRPIIGSRPGASRTPAAPAAPAGPCPVLDPHGAAHPDRQQPGNRECPGPGGRRRASPACPVTVREPGQKPQTPRLTRPRSFRDDIGPALLTMLRTVAGLRDRAPRPWTGSWTEPSVQPVRSGPSAARLRGIRAASAHDARGRASHNPPVGGSSPTRPTSHARPSANAAGQVCAPKTSTLHRATPLRLIRASAVIKETLRASAKATY